jgi:hypothetical protein
MRIDSKNSVMGKVAQSGSKIVVGDVDGLARSIPPNA